jgi:hypothetical protein
MIKEVNVGVDTDAMAADVYNEIHTPGFKEPNSEFIFKKRRTVRNLYKIKNAIKKTDFKDKKSVNKLFTQIKSFAFDIYSYDANLAKAVNLNEIKAKKLTKKDILDRVTKDKYCTDHSFSEEELLKCRTDFVTLAGEISKNQAKELAKKIKPKNKENRGPITKEEAIKDIVGNREAKCQKAPKPNTWFTKELKLTINFLQKGKWYFTKMQTASKKKKSF